MKIKMQCCKCRKTYNWYEGVFENPDYDFMEAMRKRKNNEEYVDSGIFVKANCFILKRAEPCPEKAGEKQEIENANGNLEEQIINLCEDCMRELLSNIYPCSDNNCFWTV